MRQSSSKVPFLTAAGTAFFCMALLLAFPPVASAGAPAPEWPNGAARSAEPGGARTTADRTGVLQTRDGLTLRLTTDLATVKIVALEPGASNVVRYSVHLETDARPVLAQKILDKYVLAAKATAAGVEITGNLPSQAQHSDGAQYWVQFEVAVPANYSVDVNTGAGDISAGDIGGTASLVTQGGNIRAGRIGTSGLRSVSAGRQVARLETGGGHIDVQDVAGDIVASTAGGHVTIHGSIAGDANLHTGGGHIRAGAISGKAQLETAGGNISVGRAGGFATVHTGGGQIAFGEVRGSVHAQTGGGGIRILYVSGPMEVESGGGSICLTRVGGSVRAATGDGTITAWINPDASAADGAVHLAGASQLASGAGDIVVFLPRNLAATIDATVETGGAGRIESDPALPLVIQAPVNPAAGPVRAMANLNGGGALLKLRTSAGKIKLQFLDAQTALRDTLIRDQEERLRRNGIQVSRVVYPGDSSPQAEVSQEEQRDWLATWINQLEVALRGGVGESADEFQKRLTYSPRPAYPEIARRAGIHGTVSLQVRLTKDGHVEVQKLLEGEPVLADAAVDAVKKWQAKPALLKGKKVEVISTVTFNFQLQ